MEEIEAFKFW